MQLNADIGHKPATFLGAALAMLCLFSPMAWANQSLVLSNISAAEYFVGTDPGEGAGTPLSPEDGNFDTDVEGTQELDLDVSGLAPGEHRVGIRYKDDANQWGPVRWLDLTIHASATTPETNLQTTTLANITAAEYFVGTDPGEGAGTPLSPEDGNFDSDLEGTQELDLDVSGLAHGEHRVGIRYKDDANQWSPVRWLDLTIHASVTTPETDLQTTTLSKVIAAEYFVGTDPGAGAGTPLSPKDGNFDSDVEGTQELDLNVSALPPGEHRVGIRYKDDSNQWSPVRWLDLTIHASATTPETDLQTTTLSNVIAAEYFVGTDPGEGAGTPLSPEDGNFDSDLEGTQELDLNVSGFAPGEHRVGIRYKDDANQWSPVRWLDLTIHASATTPETDLQTTTLSKIIAAEYFVGTDPGEGAGTPLSPEDGNFDTDVEGTQELDLDVSGFAPGEHRVGIRYKDDSNQWSPVRWLDLTIHSTVTTPETDLQSATLSKVTAAEYFVGTDPGEGAGTPLSPEDGNFDTDLEGTQELDLNVSALAPGEHRVGIRYKDDANQWSPVRWLDLTIHSAVTTPETDLQTTTLSNVTAAEYFVGTDPGEGAGTPLSPEDGNFDSDVEGTQELDLNVSGLALGEHRVGIRYKDDSNQWSPVRWLDLTIDPPGPNTDLDGDGFTYAQETNATSNPNDPSSTPLSIGLVAWYPFDGNASDMSGNGNHGTVNGATPGADRHGVTQKAYSFDGVDDFIALNNASILGTTDKFSIFSWINLTGDNNSIYGEFHAAQGHSRNWFTISGTSLSLDQYFPAGSVSASDPIPQLSTLGKWYLVGLVRNGSNWTFYFDGASVKSGSNAENYSGANPDNAYIGARAYTYQGYAAGAMSFFTGSMDEIRIYNRALSPSVIATLYQLEKPNYPPTDLNSTTPLAIAENQSIGTVVGEFNATDRDTNATLTYHLASGAGDTQNSLFTLETNGTLKTATTFDFESNSSTYAIRVQVKDEHNASVEGNFTVTLTDALNEGPPMQIDGNSNEVKTLQADATNWVKKKTIAMPLETLVTEVRNQIRNHVTTPSWIAECKMKFIYADGSNDESSIESHGSNGFTNKTYHNPHPLKQVGSVEVWLRQSTLGNDKRAYERNTIVFGYTKNATNTQPVFSSGGGASAFSVAVLENDGNVTTLSATDPEAVAVVYAIEGGADSSGFSVDSSSGKLTFLLPPDFESPIDSGLDNQYEVLVRASDGTLYSDQNVTVIVTDVYEPSQPNHLVDLNSTVNLEMIWVEPGTFTMGSPLSEPDRRSDETQHQVTLTQGFYLGKYEVTQAQYQSVMTGNSLGLNHSPSNWPGPNRPVDEVSWYDLQVFLSELNEAQRQAGNLPNGWAYVLPTEAQWEYACRAGTTTAMSFGNSLSSLQANFDGARPYAGAAVGPGLWQTKEVGTFAQNPWGFWDMHGNVWEFTSDKKRTFTSGNIVDPVGPSSGGFRVRKGGGGGNAGDHMRSAMRGISTPESRGSYLGFRLAYRQVTTPPSDLNSTAPLAFFENSPVGTVVGEFNATDPDANATLTYHLVSGAGDTHNSLFTLETNGTLKTAVAFDYESNASSYAIRVQAKDEFNATVEGNFTVTLADANDPPVITTPNFANVPENQTFAIELNATDPDGDVLSYSIAGGTDASLFSLNQATRVLTFLQAPDYEANASASGNNSYLIIAQVSDGTVDVNQTLTVNVTDVYEAPPNSAPTDLNSTGALSVAENQPVGTLVGGFTATDPDANATLSYTLVLGATQNDNHLFTLDTNGTLKTATVFDYESNASTYSIRVQARDEHNATAEGNFTVTLTDVYEAPPDQTGGNENNSTAENNTTTNPGDSNATQTDSNSSTTDNNATNPDNNASQPEPPPIELFRPVVETQEAKKIFGTSATLHGKLVDNGGSPVTERGFLLSPKPNPKPGRQNVQRLVAENGPGIFKTDAANLKPGKKYFYRALATNQEGTSLGSVETFTTIAGPLSPSWIEAQPGTANNWWTSPWFGNFYLNANGWARHEKLGWVFPMESPTAGLWLWKEGMGWLWTDKGIYPFLYDNSKGGWLYFYGQRNGTLLFYDYSAKRWITTKDGQ